MKKITGWREYTPPDGAIELATKRTDFLFHPHVLATKRLGEMLAMAYLQGMIDCGDAIYSSKKGGGE